MLDGLKKRNRWGADVCLKAGDVDVPEEVRK